MSRKILVLTQNCPGLAFRKVGNPTLEVSTVVEHVCKSNRIGVQIYPAIVIVSCGSFDAKCVLNASLESGDFHYECFKESFAYGSVNESLAHTTKASVQFDELKHGVPDRFRDKVSLRVTANVTIFKPRSGTNWVASTLKNPVVPDARSPPLLRHLLSRKNTDVVVECDGIAIPVHSLVLKCMSPIFANMLNTDMKEAASGLIKVEDIGSAAVGRMLGFMYTGNLFQTKDEPAPDEIDDVLIELLHCAEKYEIAEMKDSVLTYMKAKLSTLNAIYFANAAGIYGAEASCVQGFLDFCKENLSELPKGPELQEFVVKNAKSLY